jgi:peptide subunit release factor 1 (eRF1)
MSLQDRITRLAKLHVPTGVVSVYLNTRWADEHQRDRTRLFVREEVQRARHARARRDLDAALAWIEGETDALVGQARDVSVPGAALFVCPAAGVREVIASRAPFEPAFVVGDVAYLRPLAAVLGENPPALVAFVDGERARLIPLTTEGVGEEVVLQSAVPGHHRRGGWAQLAQSRYARHIEQHRGEHYDAVAEAVGASLDERQVRWVILAGESGTLGAVRDRLPPAVRAAVAGTVRAAWHEPAAAIAARADEAVHRAEAASARQAVAQAMTDAAKGQRAVTGVDDTLAAASRGAVRQLLVLRELHGERPGLRGVRDAQPRRARGMSPVSRRDAARGTGRRGGGPCPRLRGDGGRGGRRHPAGQRRRHGRPPALPALTLEPPATGSTAGVPPVEAVAAGDRLRTARPAALVPQSRGAVRCGPSPPSRSAGLRPWRAPGSPLGRCAGSSRSAPGPTIPPGRLRRARSFRR